MFIAQPYSWAISVLFIIALIVLQVQGIEGVIHNVERVH
jgi:hypothetical protein